MRGLTQDANERPRMSGRQPVGPRSRRASPRASGR